MIAFHTFFSVVETGLIAYVALINTTYFLLTAAGYFALRHERRRSTSGEAEALLKSPLVPGLSVIAPAFNEQASICQSVRSMLRLRVPQLEVIVVNDGSTDRTMALLIEEFRLYRSSREPSGHLSATPVRAVYESRAPVRLVVIDKENSGKADSLNVGISYSRMPLVAAVDADSILDRDALIGVLAPFLRDPETVAAGGIVRVANGCRIEDGEVLAIRAPRHMLARLQVVEYLRAFLSARVAFSAFNALALISGTFGVFRRDMVIKAGGFASSTVGEDMEMVVRLHHMGCDAGRRPRITFVAEPVCWTEVPQTLASLRRQRNRWQRGAIESLQMHRGLLFHRRSGLLGWAALPYLILFEVLGPIVELIGGALTLLGWVFGLVAPSMALQFFVVSIVFGMTLSAASVLLEEMTTRKYPSTTDLVRLLAAAVVESLGYRQLTAVWRLEGIWAYLRGKKDWGRQERRGFVQA
jgi:cellulose synthase/poly-beta-1,6-N-acetylglucosamine synthase-like glycosyltransferase